MHDLRRISCTLTLAIPIALVCVSRLQAQVSQPEAVAAVRSVVASELRANDTDKSIWTYRDHETSSTRDAIYKTVETREGELRRMVELNGQPLTVAQGQEERSRISTYVGDNAAQAKARKNGQHDDAQASELIKMLPDAFLWTIAAQTPEEVDLRFVPNPAFNPPDMEARVMGIMGGQMVIARDGNRIKTLRGSLSQDVKFGYGLFGRLDKGGTFDIERRQVAPGHWQITETHVHIGGKALLFRTIGQQQDEVKTDWRPSTDATLAAAAHTLGIN